MTEEPDAQDGAARPSLWLGERHQQLLAALVATALDAGRLVILTGDIGGGKTWLAEALVAQLAARATVVHLRYPWLEPSDLFSAIGRGLGFEVPDGTRATLLDGLQRLRLRPGRTRMPLVIIADEAQQLSPAVLHELGELLRAEPVVGTPRPSVVLVGQEALHTRLAENELQNLVSRVERIPALDRAEIEDFLRHRLVLSGVEPDRLTATAVETIVSMSAGVPRVINRLCDLTSQHAPPRGPIDARLVREAVRRFGYIDPPEGLNSAAQPSRAPSEPVVAATPRRAFARRYRAFAVGLVAAGVMAMSVMARQGGVDSARDFSGAVLSTAGDHAVGNSTQAGPLQKPPPAPSPADEVPRASIEAAPASMSATPAMNPESAPPPRGAVAPGSDRAVRSAPTETARRATDARTPGTHLSPGRDAAPLSSDATATTASTRAEAVPPRAPVPSPAATPPSPDPGARAARTSPGIDDGSTRLSTAPRERGPTEAIPTRSSGTTDASGPPDPSAIIDWMLQRAGSRP